MSESLVWLGVIGSIWVVIGVVLSIVMGRRGHLSFGWGILGATLGPLAPFVALAAARHEAEEGPCHVVSAASAGGSVDVLVGIDGSPECQLAMERAVSMLGPQLGRLTLATVVPFDDVPSHTRNAIAELDRHARLSGVPAAGEELLYGPPARALADFASAGGYGLLVVGTRGGGLATTVLGSTASKLAAGSPVPVLVGAGTPGRSLGA